MNRTTTIIPVVLRELYIFTSGYLAQTRVMQGAFERNWCNGSSHWLCSEQSPSSGRVIVNTGAFEVITMSTCCSIQFSTNTMQEKSVESSQNKTKKNRTLKRRLRKSDLTSHFMYCTVCTVLLWVNHDIKILILRKWLKDYIIWTSASIDQAYVSTDTVHLWL